MNERMDEYVRLFLVHPDHRRPSEIHFTEKRGALVKTIEAAMLGHPRPEIPADKPLFISYEKFGEQFIKANSVLAR